MQKVRIPWGCWYENCEHEIYFPNDWDINFANMAEFPEMCEEDIYKAIETPIGTPSLEEIAKGKKSVCIVVDDISRPTPVNVILPMVINKLIQAGISRNDISIVIAIGAHRPMTKQDMLKKLGEEIIDTIEVFNHNPFSDDLVPISDSELNWPIKVNRHFVQADLKIAIGCIVPHSLAGFSGGAKIIIPGIGGIETLEFNHKFAYQGDGNKRQFHVVTANNENPVRNNMESIVRKVGLDFIVNVVLNSKLKIAGVFAGDFVKAHRIGCDFAKKVYSTKLVPEADIVVLNAFPKDTEYSQIGTAFSVLGNNPRKCVKNNESTIILTTAASEGAGFHNLFGPGMRLFSPHENNLPPYTLAGIKTYIYSPNLSFMEIKKFFNKSYLPLYNKWEDLEKELEYKYRQKAKVAIYPLASMQIGYHSA